MVLLSTLGIVTAIMIALWIVSLPIRNVAIVDIFWGLGFAVIAWTAFLLTPAIAPRRLMMSAMVTLWGARLAAHLARRNIGHGEDYRYRAMREAWGARFPIVSLGTVFLLQAALMWIVSLPAQAVQLPSASAPIGWIDLAGAIVWAAGLTIETLADWQLSRFRCAKSRPRSVPNCGKPVEMGSDPFRGGVLDTGLWRYSRHPNYFGDALGWWGIGAIAVGAGAWWALVGPIVMTVLLVRVSGVALLEQTIVDRRPAYRDYIARTSAFIPWPPKRRRHGEP